jgi:hypothetical protein
LAATRKDTPGRQRGDHDNRGLFYRPEERQHDCPSVPLAALRIAHNSPTCRYGMTWTPPAKGGPLLGERRPEFASGNERTFGGRCVETLARFAKRIVTIAFRRLSGIEGVSSQPVQRIPGGASETNSPGSARPFGFGTPGRKGTRSCRGSRKRSLRPSRPSPGGRAVA